MNKKYIGVIVGVVICAVVLFLCYPKQENLNTQIIEQYDENITGEKIGETPKPEEAVKTEEPAKVEKQEKNAVQENKTPEPSKPLEDESVPVQEEEKITDSCYLTVRCDTILNNTEKVSPEKLSLIPLNGIIIPEEEFEFSDGESVFDVLKRVLKNKGVHFEFSKVAMYDSVYIEGIANLYEFDAGDLSGWIYRVNGKSPSVGCSQYKIENGDKIEILYTCNMGRDL